MKATTLNVLDPQPFLRIAINPRYFETNPSEFARVGDTVPGGWDRGKFRNSPQTHRTMWPAQIRAESMAHAPAAGAPANRPAAIRPIPPNEWAQLHSEHIYASRDEEVTAESARRRRRNAHRRVMLGR